MHDVRPTLSSLFSRPALKLTGLLSCASCALGQYTSDFYSHEILVVVLGYIRPELNYISKGPLHFFSCCSRVSHLV